MTSQHAGWLLFWLAISSGCTAKVGDAPPAPEAAPHGPQSGGSAGGGSTPSGASGVGGGSSAMPDGPPVPEACSPLAPVARRLWRLSAAQYANSVRDLLGLASTPQLTNRGGTEYAFFSDDSAVVDDNLQYAMYQVAEGAVAAIRPGLVAMAACATGETPTACAQRFAVTFGQRAFRRPLDPSEVTALLEVYAEGSKQDFATGIALMVEALIQAPSFVHRTELGPSALAADASVKTAMTPFEAATQLSLFLSDSAPDSELLSAAASGALAMPEERARQVDRLLALDAVKQNVSRVVIDWFNVRQLEIKSKDPALLHGQEQTLVEADLMTSARRFVDDVLWSGSGKVADLVTSGRVFVNQRLAVVYGYPFSGPADQFVAVSDETRAGMLTQPAFIWSLSDPAVTSIVKRGKFIHDDVICQDPGPGPGALLDDPAIQAKLATLPTERDKSQYRLATSPCVSCHAQIDPYALVLENFDPVGRFRDVADGVPVDATGTFSAPLPAGRVTGAVAFAEALVSSKLITSCAAQKIASYAIGRMIREAGTCEVNGVVAAVERGDGSVTSVFRQVALASFVHERGGVQ